MIAIIVVLAPTLTETDTSERVLLITLFIGNDIHDGISLMTALTNLLTKYI